MRFGAGTKHGGAAGDDQQHRPSRHQHNRRKKKKRDAGGVSDDPDFDKEAIEKALIGLKREKIIAQKEVRGCKGFFICSVDE